MPISAYIGLGILGLVALFASAICIWGIIKDVKEKGFPFKDLFPPIEKKK